MEINVSCGRRVEGAVRDQLRARRSEDPSVMLDAATSGSNRDRYILYLNPPVRILRPRDRDIVREVHVRVNVNLPARGVRRVRKRLAHTVNS